MRLLLDELTREEARALAPDALVVLPVGATEQHGPHLPLGTDRFAVEHIARAAAAAVADQIAIVVAPTLPFGSSHHHLPFGGTLSISTETYYRLLSDLIESLIVSGFRRLFILNGHGGNHELIQLAVRDLAQRHPVQLAAASYWDLSWDALAEKVAQRGGNLPGHAGIFETSLVLALRPELVHDPRPHRDATADVARVQRYRAEHHGAWQQIEGFTDSPDQAQADEGAAYLTAIIQAVSEALTMFYRETV